MQGRYDVIIVDTAGRLQIDERMMDELKATQRAIKPSDTLLVVDAMTGQEAASLVKAFNQAAELTGLPLLTLSCVMPMCAVHMRQMAAWAVYPLVSLVVPCSQLHRAHLCTWHAWLVCPHVHCSHLGVAFGLDTWVI